jgi:hypothetical protein
MAITNPFGPSAKQRAAKQHSAIIAEQNRGNQALYNIGQSLYGDPNMIQFSGTPAELEAQAANLSQTRAMTGYAMPEIGGLSREYGEGVLERYRGDDKVSQYMMGQRNRNMANVARSTAGRGVAGGAAAATANQAQLEADAYIASQMQSQQQAAANDLDRHVRRQQKVTGEALSGGAARGLAGAIDTSAPNGTSFICTMLRSKKLMNAKETFIMTKFMLKSMIQRADFLVWYFEHGKKAVDAAELDGFDWSGIKKLFVDDIIDLLKEGKFTQAQNLYIHRTGTFCSYYGVNNFKYSLATYRPLAALYFPRLFFIENCVKWLKANFKSIPKILTAKITY